MFINPNNIINSLGLSGKETVVDFGAGSGAYVLPIAKMIESYGGEVFAVDIQVNILKRLASNAKQSGIKNLHLIHADVENEKGTKIKEGSVDVVIISNLLHQIDRRKDTIKEAMRIVHESGHILIIDWKDSYKSMGPVHTNVFPEDDCLKLCLELGLSLDKVFEAGTHHYALFFRKNITNS